MENEIVESNLATRWSRLWASLLDTLIMICFSLPLMYFTGGLDLIMDGRQPTIAYSLTTGIAGILFFALVNAKFLLESGQTIGKKALKIKIVDMNEALPSKKHLLKRYGVYFGAGQIPIVGPYLSIVNILFIFGAAKRCLHDYAAETKVVKSIS